MKWKKYIVYIDGMGRHNLPQYLLIYINIVIWFAYHIVIKKIKIHKIFMLLELRCMPIIFYNYLTNKKMYFNPKYIL